MSTELPIERKQPGVPWSEEQDRYLIRQWVAGIPTPMIAATLGITRNAAIGRISRLGIMSEGRRKASVPMRTRREPTEPKQAAPRPPASPKPPKPVRSPPKPPAAPPVDGVGLMELRHGRDCAFPVVAAGADTRYCGAPVDDGSYCEAHRKRMYTPEALAKKERIDARRYR